MLESAIRNIRNVAKSGGTTDANMATLGIPSPSVHAPSTASVPALTVNTSERLRHKLSWTDAATPDNKRKPRGAMGAEIWIKIDGAPPTDESECRFLTLDSKTPYTAEFDGSDPVKMSQYLVIWRMTDASVSAWGDTVSATITG